MKKNNPIPHHSTTPPLQYSNTKLILILITLLLCLSCTNDVHSNPDYTKTPVFFVHGYGMKAKCWESMISYLMKSGYPRIYLKAIELRPKDGSNVLAAEREIAPGIEEFLASINAFLKKEYPSILLKTKVDLISHSMGALSARWFTAKVRPDRVRKWISIAGANHGTNMVCPPAYPTEGANDLCPAYATSILESQVQFELNGAPFIADVDETPYGIGQDSPRVDSIMPDQQRIIFYFTISTINDYWIEPDSSVVVDGAGGPQLSIPANWPVSIISEGNYLITTGVGHDPMLDDNDTINLVIFFLDYLPDRMFVDQKISEFKTGIVTDEVVKGTIKEYMREP